MISLLEYHDTMKYLFYEMNSIKKISFKEFKNYTLILDMD